MSEKFFKKTGKLIFLMMVANIAAIFITSLVPVVYETISADNPEFWVVSPPISKKVAVDNPSNQSEIKSRVHYNFFTIQKRDNTTFQELSEDLKNIYYLLWGGFISGIFSIVGLILFSTEKIPKKSKIVMSIGFSGVAFSIICFYQQWIFVDKINSLASISLSSILNPVYGLNYFYLIMLSTVVSIFGSVIYTSRISVRFFKERKEKSKKEALNKIVSENEKLENKSSKDLRETGKPFFGVSGKSEETEVGPSKEKLESKSSEKKEVYPEEKKELVETEKQDEETERKNFFGEEEKEIVAEKTDTDRKEKKKDVFNTESPEEKSKPSVKEVKIRCPKCKHVFNVKKKEKGVTQIYCPKCGQKGVLK